MLQITLWALLYLVLLLVIGASTRRVRHRAWFKLVFLPGTILAGSLKGLAALLCLGSIRGFGLFRDREAFVKVREGRLPYLPGGLCLAATHALLFALWLLGAGRLAEAGLLAPGRVRLPDLYPYDILDGVVAVDASTYLAGLRKWLAANRSRPLAAGAFFYLGLSVFASLGISGREARRGAVVLAGAGLLAHLAAWFGLGFRFLGRGWWAAFFYGSRWWELFSLFFTVAALAAGVLLLIKAAGACVPRRPSGGSPRPPRAAGKKPKARAVAKAKG
jgi:hypothetical protein